MTEGNHPTPDGEEPGARNRVRTRQVRGDVVQAGSVGGDLRHYNLSVVSAAVGAVIVLVAALTTWVVIEVADGNAVAGRPTGPGTAATQAPTSNPAPAVRQPRPARMDEGAYDKVIPGPGPAYDDVVANFSERTADTVPSKAEWLESRGAVGVGSGRWEFGLDGMRDHTVQVVRARPVDVECGPPLGGTFLHNPDAGELPVILAVDLDAPEPEFRIERPGVPGSVGLFERKIELPRNETIPFVVVARTQRSHCTFGVRLEYTADGHEHTIDIATAWDGPFEVTGPLPKREYDAVYLSPLFQCTTTWRLTGPEFADFTGQC